MTVVKKVENYKNGSDWQYLILQRHNGEQEIEKPLILTTRSLWSQFQIIFIKQEEQNQIMCVIRKKWY